MRIALAVLAGALGLVLLLLVLAPAPQTSPTAADAPPWQIDIQPDGGSRVFGLTLGRSTLDDAQAHFSREPQVAVVAARDEAGSLEAYFESVTAGFVTGKVILTLDAPKEVIAAMRSRAAKTEYTESAARRALLAAEDRQVANRAAIRSIAFIPSANLDEATILQRFGPPAERLGGGENIEHFLYPAKGLDVVLDAKGKELLQYVAPRDFARLREPLATRPAARAAP